MPVEDRSYRRRLARPERPRGASGIDSSSLRRVIAGRMKLVRRLVFLCLWFATVAWSFGQEAGTAAPAGSTGAAEQAKVATAAAAAVASGVAEPRTPDFLEHMVDLVQIGRASCRERV